MKAMILAAGRGTRMGELSRELPKPLLPVAGKPLIAHTLTALAKANIREIVINISYLGEIIQETLGDGKKYGVNIQYSVEPTALETGGGIYQALPLLGRGPFIVVSGDIWTDYPWQQLPTRLSHLAHLVMVDNPSFHSEGDFFLTKDNKIHLEGSPKLTYASMGVLHPDLFKHCQPGIFRLTDVLLPAISQGEISGEHFNGDWMNVGTPEEWECLNQLYSPPLKKGG